MQKGKTAITTTSRQIYKFAQAAKPMNPVAKIKKLWPEIIETCFITVYLQLISILQNQKTARYCF